VKQIAVAMHNYHDALKGFPRGMTGGVIHGFADGAVAFIADGISLSAYQGLGSRNGNENVAPPE
jgi:hypothetical protein